MIRLELAKHSMAFKRSLFASRPALLPEDKYAVLYEKYRELLPEDIEAKLRKRAEARAELSLDVKAALRQECPAPAKELMRSLFRTETQLTLTFPTQKEHFYNKMLEDYIYGKYI